MIIVGRIHFKLNKIFFIVILSSIKGRKHHLKMDDAVLICHPVVCADYSSLTLPYEVAASIRSVAHHGDLSASRLTEFILFRDVTLSHDEPFGYGRSPISSKQYICLDSCGNNCQSYKYCIYFHFYTSVVSRNLFIAYCIDLYSLYSKPRAKIAK